MGYDLLIRNALVVDGTGAPGRHADVGISGGKIVSIEERIGNTATRTLDASDLVVAHRPSRSARRSACADR